MIRKKPFTHRFITGNGLRYRVHNGIPTADLNLQTVVVQGGERTLRATWTPELAQDLHAYHNVDVEQELTALLSEQVANEIDNEILEGLRARQQDHTPFDQIQFPTVGDVTVIDEDTWYCGNTFESKFIKSVVKQHEFIKLYSSVTGRSNP